MKRNLCTTAGLVALAILGAVALSSPAAASVGGATLANYKVDFSGTSSQDVFGGATFTMPAADSTNFNSTISGCCSFNQGAFDFSIQPIFFYGLPAKTPVVNTFYGLSWLGQTPSSDPSELHLVVGVGSAQASSLIGQSFDDDFSGFTPAFGDVPGGGPFTEQSMVDQLLYTAGLDQQFGLPPVPFSGPPTNLLYDFGVYLHAQGDSIVGGSGFTLLAFSNGQSLGTGLATIVPTASATPEPGTWALSMLGLAMAGAALRRRRIAAGAI